MDRRCRMRTIVRGKVIVAPIERIERRSETVDRGYVTPCRVFTGPLNREGYAQISVGHKADGDRRNVKIYRYVWELRRGPVPAGHEPDHLCRQRDCHELTHLEVVTKRENVLRGTAPSAINARKTHCIHGHELTPQNLYRVSRGERRCKACDSANASRRHAARKLRDGIPDSVGALNAAKTHCAAGHEFTPENTRIERRTDGRARRACKACARERGRLWKQRKAAA